MQFSVEVEFLESLQEESPEEAAENAHGEKEAGAAGYPMTIGGETAAGDDAM